MPPSLPFADVFFHGGEIVTLDDANSTAEALAVSGATIVAVGAESAVRAHVGPSTRMVDLRGRVLMPALRDHHLHLQAIGFALLNRERGGDLFVDLADAGSEREMVDRMVAFASVRPKGTWIVGGAWNENLWVGARMPTHHALSEALPDHPAFLVRIDSHSALVNVAAMRAAGITRDTPDPYGGEIRRLSDGDLSGLLVERAVEQVLDVMPVPSDEIVRQATIAAARSLAARGYAEVYDAGIMHFPGLVAMNSPAARWVEILRDVDLSGELPLRVNLMVAWPSPLAEELLRGTLERQLSPNVRCTHLKLYADGAFGSRGALMHEPFSDDPGNLGISRMTEAEIYEQSSRGLDAGLDVAIHAIGDAAVTRVLDVYERLLGERPGLAPRRLRLEHLSVGTADDLRRAAKLGILVVAQPAFVWPMANGHCMEDSRVGPERLTRTYAWRTLLDLGASVAGSSDDYGLPPHALMGIYAAASRMNPEGIPHEGWQPQERLTRLESLRLWTRRAAPGGAWEGGTLVVGAPANLMVLSGNPVTVRDDELLSIQVVETYRHDSEL
jgi:predicted amidohydrolase YtcJ